MCHTFLGFVIRELGAHVINESMNQYLLISVSQDCAQYSLLSLLIKWEKKEEIEDSYLSDSLTRLKTGAWTGPSPGFWSRQPLAV